MEGLRRKAYDRLLEWKSNSCGRTALMIDGARRVGKSYLAEEFGKREYRSYIVIDFSDVSDEVRGFFQESSSDMDLFFNKLSFYFATPLYERESLIILDEVQFFPYARQKIKKLVADGRFDYIETGSLLSIRENTEGILIPSEEVHMTLHPMDFEEFLWAMGDTTTMPYLKKCFEDRTPVGIDGHRRAMNLFRQYIVIGGMPEVVNTYVRTKDFRMTDQQKVGILDLYRNDVTKFANGYKRRVEEVFDTIPAELSRKDKKFSIASMNKNARMRDYDDAFLWLDDAMIVNLCFNSTDPNVGLLMNENRSILKCYMADTGLLLTLAMAERDDKDQDFYRDIILDRMNVNEGMFLENIVAQSLVANGMRLYFYTEYDETTKKSLEIDFLIRRNGKISPVEVKSGNRIQHSSLDKFLVKFKKRLGQAYVLCTKDLHEKNGIIYLPLYMAGLL